MSTITLEDGRRFTSSVEKQHIVDKASGMRKIYRLKLMLNGVETGHIKYKCEVASAGCFSLKGDKTLAVEFDDIAVEDDFRADGLSFLLIWSAAMHATNKGYGGGTVRSIMTVGSYATFKGAGFRAITGISKSDREKIVKIDKSGRDAGFATNDDLRAASDNAPLATIRAACEAAIQNHHGATTAFSA